MRTPARAHAYCVSPEQSKPTVVAPRPIPKLGPFAPPPPHEYGTPRISSAAFSARSPAFTLSYPLPMQQKSKTAASAGLFLVICSPRDPSPVKALLRNPHMRHAGRLSPAVG
ncbi:hypothetical protein GCM10020219_060240 [Nonomuraea dietziae]